MNLRKDHYRYSGFVATVLVGLLGLLNSSLLASVYLGTCPGKDFSFWGEHGRLVKGRRAALRMARFKEPLDFPPRPGERCDALASRVVALTE